MHAFQPLVSRFAIHDFLVGTEDERTLDDLLALLGTDRAYLRAGRTDERPFHHARLTALPAYF